MVKVRYFSSAWKLLKDDKLTDGFMGCQVHWKKKWSLFDLKSWVNDSSMTKIRPLIHSNWRIFESNWLSISSQFDSTFLRQNDTIFSFSDIWGKGLASLKNFFYFHRVHLSFNYFLHSAAGGDRIHTRHDLFPSYIFCGKIWAPVRLHTKEPIVGLFFEVCVKRRPELSLLYKVLKLGKIRWLFTFIIFSQKCQKRWQGGGGGECSLLMIFHLKRLIFIAIDWIIVLCWCATKSIYSYICTMKINLYSHTLLWTMEITAIYWN